jgi:hypothetical protein
MGYRGTTNTLLNFGEGVHSPGRAGRRVGYLVGEQHRGLTYMFHMMNEARIGVGMGATVLGYTGYLHALDYARTRTAGRPGRREGPEQPAGADHRAPRRPPDAAGRRSPTRREGWRSACTAPAWSTRSRRRSPRRARPGATCCWRC